MPDTEPGLRLARYSKKILKIIKKTLAFFAEYCIIKKSLDDIANMRIWRNWQTRTVQVRVRVTSWGFESLYPHQLIEHMDNVLYFNMMGMMSEGKENESERIKRDKKTF